MPLDYWGEKEGASLHLLTDLYGNKFFNGVSVNCASNFDTAQSREKQKCEASHSAPEEVSEEIHNQEASCGWDC